MSDMTAVSNPFMLMTHPEVVIAAMEKSERLAQLNRHLCRPLDRIAPHQQGGEDAELEGTEKED